MKKLLTRNGEWLNPLGAIATIIVSLITLITFLFWPESDEATQVQNAVVTGNDSEVHQTQDDSEENQRQDATVEGDGSSVFQKQ